MTRWIHCALVLLLGSLMGMGAGLGMEMSSAVAGPCPMAMDAPTSSGASEAMSASATATVARTSDDRVPSDGSGSLRCRDHPAGLVGMCLVFLAVLVMVGQVLRPGLAVVQPDREKPWPRPGRRRAAGAFAPRLARLCVLRI